MAAGTRVLCFLIICSLVGSSRALTNITAENITADPGQDVILTCKVPNNINVNKITAVEWIRPDQEAEYVLLYWNGHFNPDNQHKSYKNRVELQDKEMKDGNVSLILKNVTMEDTGRYECRVFEEKPNEPISIINLEVYGDKGGITGDGGDKDGIIAGSVGSVILLLAVAALGFLISRQRRRQNPNFSVPPDEAAAMEMLPVPEQHQNKPELM